jgi:6-phosphogluconolactonase
MDNLVMYEVDSNTGKLKVIGYHSANGKAPRFFTFDPSGKFLLVANQNSSNVVVYSIDKLTGKIVGEGKNIEIPTPVCIQFLK